MIRRTLLAFAFALLSFPVHAQVTTGLYTYGSFDNLGFDSIDRGSLNTAFNISLVNKPGRKIPFYYALEYNGTVWSPSTVNGSATWTPVQGFGWQGDTNVVTGTVSYVLSGGTTLKYNPQTQQYIHCTSLVYSAWQYTDIFGVRHSFVNTYTRDSSGNDPACFASPRATPASVPTATAIAIDGSGYTLSLSNYLDSTISTRTGATFIPAQSGSKTATDANGNQVTTDGRGNFTDTTGAKELTITGSGTAASPKVFSYLTYNPNNTTSPPSASATIYYKTYQVQTAFGCSSVGDYNQSADLVDHIVLADGSSIYKFNYEPTPGNAANVTGRLASVRLPTGGTISYAYNGGNNGINCADGTPTGLTRTTSDGARTYIRSSITATTSHTDIADGSATPNHSTFDFVVAGSPTPSFYETNEATY